MKANIRKQMNENNITVYYFSADGELELDCNSESSNLQPYSVVGSNYISENGKIRAREYPWGTVNVDNPKHSDLKFLRDSLMKTSMYNLIDKTDSTFYEKYREKRLY